MASNQNELTPKENVRERMKALREQINYHAYRYHVLDSPVISDAEYDALFNELKALETEYPDLVTADSPTQRVGADPLDAFEKVEHPVPILSLANAFDKDELREWEARTRRRLDQKEEDSDQELNYVVEPKIDGLTVVLRYENGRFVQAATRGNGEVGEDITKNLRTVNALPLTIPVDPDSDETVPDVLVVRGEAFFPLSAFEAWNRSREEAGEKTYMNPRNAAAGSLRQLDSSITAERPLALFCYDVILTDGGDAPETQWQRLQWLQKLGFPVADEVVYAETLEEMVAQYDRWLDLRNEIDYEVDGIVVKINDRPLAASLGFRGKDPRGAIAGKFPAQEKTTTLLDYKINVGRTGVLNPSAVLEAGEIGGVVVRSATLHNFDEIERKDIRVGDKVWVKRAGEVIPYVVGPITDLRDGSEEKIERPTHCPVCGEPVLDAPEEVAVYCENASCPEQLVRRVEYFVSRPAMDIAGFGEKTAALLIEKDLIHDLADVYYLDRADLLALEGFKEKKVDNLLDGVENSKQQSATRFLTALGIRYVGEVAAGLLLDELRSIDALSTAEQETVEEIHGIGPGTAAAVCTWFDSEKNQQLLEKFRRAGLPFEMPAEAEEERPQPFEGLTFVITGTLPDMTRKEAKTYIEERGGKVTGSVSGNTDYLLAGDNAGSKLDKARKLAVSILSQDDLHRMTDK